MTLSSSHAYTFLVGLYVGRYTNIFSNLVITGLITYIIHPELYTADKLETCRNFVWSKISYWFNNKKIILNINDPSL